MDLADFSKDRFEEIRADYNSFVTQLDIPDVTFIPLSALKGDNVVDKSENMPWYHGECLLEFLENVQVASDRNFTDLRYPVQYVLRPDIKFRGFSTSVASGIIRKGDEVMVLPSMKKSKVEKIVTYDKELDYAFPPQSVTVTLEDEIDISRGDMLVHPDNLPRVERQFEAMLVWMDENEMNLSTQFYIKHASNTTKARIDAVKYKVDVNTLEKSSIEKFKLNEIGRVVVTTTKPLFFDPYKQNKQTGSFILIDPVTHNTCAVGMIIDRLGSKNLPSRITDTDKAKIAKGEPLVKTEDYVKQYNQKGETIWITGLHGSGKNELAFSLEKKLFENGATVVLIDGSSVRSGLSRELDFTPADRAENLRRVAHICKLLNDQGIIAIASFISRNESLRNQVAEIIGEERFHLFHMDESLEYCKQNKPELYELLEQGKTTNLPGVDMEYEAPTNAKLVFNPKDNEENLDAIIDYLAANKVFPNH
jgi:bifunctional enzyme CysN/CysC